MIVSALPLHAIPAPMIGAYTEAACPWCRAVVTVIPGESGDRSRPVEVLWWDPPESGPDRDARGRFRGWVYAAPHLCRSMLAAFQDGARARAGKGGDA
jgi:hypothetical protein